MLALAVSAAFEWTFAGPDAKLTDKSGKQVGKYYAGPTWESSDGSSMEGVTYIQRVNTQGGVAPKDACGRDNVATPAPRGPRAAPFRFATMAACTTPPRGSCSTSRTRSTTCSC